MCTRLELEDVTTYEASEITVKHGDAQINVNIALILRASLEFFSHFGFSCYSRFIRYFIIFLK